MKANTDFVIIGAGLAGLCCARRLQQAGADFQLLEASDAVGGRVRTDIVDGFRLYRGFQILLTAYPGARDLLDYDRLTLHPFDPGALVRFDGRFYRLADPTRHPLDALAGAIDMDQEELARQVASYNLLAIPVLDNDNRLVGIITVDDVVDVIREEATEDMLKMAGAIEEGTASKSSSLASAKHRLPWLFTNLVGSLLSGAILWEFRYTIQEVVAIVTFIPVIAAMGGNVGLQSSTLIIPGLATGLIELTDVRTVFLREIKIGLLMGLACGVILTVVGWIWHQEFLGMVVGVSLILAFMVSR